jgi:hypothetical protein
MLTTFHAIALALLANGLIYVGLAWVNAQLLPGVLGPLYNGTPVFARLVVMQAIAGLPAGWLLSRVYTLVSPGTAGAAVFGTLFLVLSAKAALLQGAWPGGRPLAAVAITIAAARWAAHELARIG